MKRLLSSLIVLFLMVCFVFILLRISPGDPSLKFVSPELNPVLAQKVKDSFGLNRPIPEQFVQFISNIFSGNFGVSYDFRKPVTEVISNHLPFTIIFSLISFIIQLSVSYFLAIWSIKKMNGFVDRLLSKTSLVFYALPSFVIGVFLIFIFSEKLHLLPASGLSSYDVDSLSAGERYADYLLHMILPVITLSLGGIAVFYKYLRDNLDEIFNKMFILNLSAFGLSPKEITKKHVIPNAISPLISVAGVELGVLFSGALITEVIFGLPGMGRLTVNAILSRDYPLVVGCTFMSGLLIIICNLIADLLKAKIDKRLIRGMLN
ncbi:MAG: ABC transporter permease [Ignavibacteriaceae bacterium]|nr:ABC transporter permease [Ignavibacteriaceae bacterium]